jgi:hypothetical protein
MRDEKFHGTGETFLFSLSEEKKEAPSDISEEDEEDDNTEETTANTGVMARKESIGSGSDGNCNKDEDDEDDEADEEEEDKLSELKERDEDDLDEEGDLGVKCGEKRRASVTSELDDHDSIRVFTWSMINDFFVNCSNTTIRIGAGDGNFGLQLDGDLNHGRTQPCDTYQNEPLTPTGDFLVKAVEVWAFG